MRRYKLFILLMVVTMGVYAQVSFDGANAAYEKGDYDQAVIDYNQLIDEQGTSATIHYNLGNAYYKLGNIPQAIIEYERALALNSRMKDAAYNLELANNKIRDKIEPIPEPLLTTLWINLLRWLSPVQWMILAILMSLLTLTGAYFLFRSERVAHRRNGLIIMVSAGIICVVFTILAIASRNYMLHHREGVIIDSTVILRSEPSESSTSLFILHEGLKLEILRDDRDWYYVEMPDGNTGWLKQVVIEII